MYTNYIFFFRLQYQVDEAAFETNEERVLWNTFLSVKTSINPGTFYISSFILC